MLTKRQRDTLCFLEDWKRSHGGQTPTYDTIAEALGVTSKSGVHRLVNGLVERGFVLHAVRDTEIHILKTVTGGKVPPPAGRIPIYRSGDHKIMGFVR